MDDWSDPYEAEAQQAAQTWRDRQESSWSDGFDRFIGAVSDGASRLTDAWVGAESARIRAKSQPQQNEASDRVVLNSGKGSVTTAEAVKWGSVALGVAALGYMVLRD